MRNKLNFIRFISSLHMGKGKKKKKHQVIYRAVKPVIKDDRILLSLLGAVGLGVTLASVTGLDEGKALVSKIRDAVIHLEELTGVAKKKKPKLKKIKPADPES
ncbi:hypothetical protein AAE02nite_22510 [Adhaeribacter aerolatus]|uniref:Uncharacterized protein n=1 Tax=Adhaeribacter aerolatus TaxID=670289 RepID=A0A512AYK3_9BACT|nr:hypothetical protein [Adhaeribacter aerolatus]GEO04587.1 hypothetical protein AAE02nite_22510 [Adhaeribacter aerolatus]